MTITDNGSGRYTLVFDAGERAMLLRAARRYGVASFKNALESWLRSAGGPEAEAEEVKAAYLKLSDDQVKGTVRTSLGLE